MKLKIYKKLTAIETFWGIVYTTATVEQLDILTESRKFISVWEQRIAVHQIKSYWEIDLWEIEGFILSQNKDIQNLLRKREKEKIGLVWRWFDSITEMQNFILRKNHNEKNGK